MSKQNHRSRRFLLVAKSPSMIQLLGDAMEEKIGLSCMMHLIDERDQHALDSIEEEKSTSGAEALVIVTDSLGEEDDPHEIYTFWHGHFPKLPIVWCHGDTNDEFFGNKEWKGITWVDLDMPARKNMFTELTNILNKIAD